MTLYRCNFLNVNDHIEAHDEIDAGSLIDAIDRANAMLDPRSHHNALEVWASSRWIYRAGRHRQGASTASLSGDDCCKRTSAVIRKNRDQREERQPAKGFDNEPKAAVYRCFGCSGALRRQ